MNRSMMIKTSQTMALGRGSGSGAPTAPDLSRVVMNFIAMERVNSRRVSQAEQH